MGQLLIVQHMLSFTLYFFRNITAVAMLNLFTFAYAILVFIIVLPKSQERWRSIYTGIALAGSLFFFMIQFSEIWLWCIGACVYIIPILSGILLVYILHRPIKTFWSLL